MGIIIRGGGGGVLEFLVRTVEEGEHRDIDT